MKTVFSAIVTCALAGALSACAAGQGYKGPRLAPTANPSAVIATELAFARAAREEGQWTAFRQFGAENALIFGRNGAIEAQPWLRQQENPAQAVSWEPFAVWSSCDGSLAATRGSYAEPDGGTGYFHTVWERQQDGTYKWIFDFGTPTEFEPAEPEIISANIADCKLADKDVVADPALNIRRSADKTMAWSFQLGENGKRTLYVWTADKDGMKLVLEAAADPIAE